MYFGEPVPISARIQFPVDNNLEYTFHCYHHPENKPAKDRLPRAYEDLLVERTNEQWISDLRSSGSAQDEALEDLRVKIRKGLPYSLSKWLTPSDPNFDTLADEVVQETLLRVLDHLESFEGRSKFTTWAHKIAVRGDDTQSRSLRRAS
jgi:hypothetical protein